ncbi:MAG: FkbM family methyltransferase [Geminicoccaceae bacterium]
MNRLTKLARCLTNRTYLQSLSRGVAASVEHEPTLRGLTPHPATIVDIGANRGQFATLARHLWPRADIHAIEPLQAPRTQLDSVAGMHCLTTHHVAISSKAGSRKMFVSRRDDSSSLLPIGDGQTSAFPGTDAVGQEIVKTCRLSDIISPSKIHRPAFLKIDVQGSEYDVLRGCEDLLSAFKWIYVECSETELYEGQALRPDIQAWLEARGFMIESIGPTAMIDGEAVQMDILFQRVSGGESEVSADRVTAQQIKNRLRVFDFYAQPIDEFDVVIDKNGWEVSFFGHDYMCRHHISDDRVAENGPIWIKVIGKGLAAEIVVDQ